MSTRVRWMLPVALGAALAAWIGAGELPLPARVLSVLLVAVLPVLMLSQGAIGSEDDIADIPVVPLYVSSMLMIWAIGAAAVLAARQSGMSLESLGLVTVDPVTGLAWTGGITAVALAVLIVGRLLGSRESPMLRRLLPRTASQRGLFVLVSLSAGVGEELAFRGFLIPALETASGSRVLAVVVSSLGFGMLHAYQGAAGAIRAGVLGALLAVPLLATGSLYPSIAAHALYDLIAGLLLADWLLQGADRIGGKGDREH